MKTLLIVGSGDLLSHSLVLGQYIAARLRELGTDAEVINLAELQLPIYDRTAERAGKLSARVKDFLSKSYTADAFVWITPIYHNSFSGMLKNALDWQHTKFPGKVVGLASNGGDRSPQAMDQLMTVARAQHLITARVRVATQETDYNTDHELTDPGIISRVNDFAEEIVDLTARVKVHEMQERAV